MTRSIQRRDVLKVVGAAGVAGIAGCTTDEPEDDDGADDTNGMDDTGDEVEAPDAVMVVGFPQSGIQLFRDYYGEFADDHEDLQIIVPDGLIDDSLPGEVDNPMNNVTGTAPATDGPGAEFFAETYEDAYGRGPGVFNAQAYDAMAVAVLATVAAGEVSGPEIRDYIPAVANPGGEEFGPSDLEEALETVAAGDPVSYQGASSSVEFDENGDMRAVAYDVIEFQDGELNTVDTIEFEADDVDEPDMPDPVGTDDIETMVGVLLPETGDLGTLGEPIRDAALLAADQINDFGLDITVDTQVEDTQTDPQAGISGANALVNAGYGVVVGAAASNVTNQVAEQVFIPNSVPAISPSSTDPGITDLDDNGFIFRTCPSDALQGPVMADVALDQLGVSSSGTLFLNDDYGQALEGSYATAFQDNGGDLRNQVSFEPEQPSYSSQWAEVLDI